MQHHQQQQLLLAPHPCSNSNSSSTRPRSNSRGPQATPLPLQAVVVLVVVSVQEGTVQGGREELLVSVRLVVAVVVVACRMTRALVVHRALRCHLGGTHPSTGPLW